MPVLTNYVTLDKLYAWGKEDDEVKMIYPVRLAKILDGLAFDFHHFTMEKFVAHIERRIGHEICLIPWDLPPGTFGSWFRGTGVEYIFFAAQLPPLLQTHIQLHEIAHLLCGHKTISIHQMSDLINLIPLLRSPRKLVDSRQEQEAEWLAALIQARVIRFNLIHELSVSVSGDQGMVELLEGLGIA